LLWALLRRFDTTFIEVASAANCVHPACCHAGSTSLPPPEVAPATRCGASTSMTYSNLPCRRVADRPHLRGRFRLGGGHLEPDPRRPRSACGPQEVRCTAAPEGHHAGGLGRRTRHRSGADQAPDRCPRPHDGAELSARARKIPAVSQEVRAALRKRAAGHALVRFRRAQSRTKIRITLN
jgi:hypothetical protein